jgi:hypothetical protein
MIQFRYGDEYVVPAVDRDVAKKTIKDADALLAWCHMISAPSG